MKSRVLPKYKTRYRVTNWREYESGLVQRGDVTIWLSPEAIHACKAKPGGRRGAQPKFSDLAIEAALTLTLVCHLPLRQAAGLLRSLFKLMGVDVEAPDHTTLSRRSASLQISLTQKATPRRDTSAGCNGRDGERRDSVAWSARCGPPVPHR